MTKAVVFNGFGCGFQVSPVTLPPPMAGQVLIAVHAAGLCASDFHLAHDPRFGAKAGDILGHEYVGRVAGLGPDTTGFAIGQPVVVFPIASCGACRACRSDRDAWCGQMQLIGGGFATHAVLDSRQCIALPTDLALDHAVLIEPLAVAHHALTRAGDVAGKRVLLRGIGPIGLACAFWARRFGAARVVAQDPNTALAPLAQTLDGATPDLAQAVHLLGGAVDVVIDCTGAAGLLDESIAVLAPQGRLVLVGLNPRPEMFDTLALVHAEAALIASAFYARADFAAAIEALSQEGASLARLVTARVGLEALSRIIAAPARDPQQCKTVCDPTSLSLVHP